MQKPRPQRNLLHKKIGLIFFHFTNPKYVAENSHSTPPLEQLLSLQCNAKTDLDGELQVIT
jgi:hypothetical protein